MGPEKNILVPSELNFWTLKTKLVGQKFWKPSWFYQRGARTCFDFFVLFLFFYRSSLGEERGGKQIVAVPWRMFLVGLGGR